MLLLIKTLLCKHYRGYLKTQLVTIQVSNHIGEHTWWKLSFPSERETSMRLWDLHFQTAPLVQHQNVRVNHLQPHSLTIITNGPLFFQSQRLFRDADVISSSLLSGRKNISPLCFSKQRSFSGQSMKDFWVTLGKDHDMSCASFKTYFWFLEMRWNWVFLCVWSYTPSMGWHNTCRIDWTRPYATVSQTEIWTNAGVASEDEAVRSTRTRWLSAGKLFINQTFRR